MRQPNPIGATERYFGKEAAEKHVGGEREPPLGAQITPLDHGS